MNNYFPRTFISSDTPLNFERRILEPSKYPVYSLPQGNVASHMMANATISNSKGEPMHIAFPLIVQQGNNLVKLNPKDAIEYALQNNEYREFPSKEEANSYANNYKRFWGREDNTSISDFKQRWLEGWKQLNNLK